MMSLSLMSPRCKTSTLYLSSLQARDPNSVSVLQLPPKHCLIKSEIKLDRDNVLGSNWAETETFCNWVWSVVAIEDSSLELSRRGVQYQLAVHKIKHFIAGVLLLHSCTVSLALSSSNFTDLSALLAFKSEIKIDPNNILGSNWTETENFCNWVGVSCSRRRQRVTALSLRNMGLQGTISPYVGNLSFLVKFDLYNNSFHGHLIPEIGHLRRLVVLNMHRNLMEGAIPTSLHQCQKLEVISLSTNKFTGVIPNWLSSLPSLHTLFLGRNNFSGTIPASLGNNSKLQWLGLERNNLHGSIPNEIENLQNLKGIDLHANNLTALIPLAIFNISSLQILSLSQNHLSGTLPPSFGLWLPNLEQLYLGINYFSGNIPLYISNCSQLKYIQLPLNQFSGPVPTSLGQLEHLQELDLEINQLTSQSDSLELSFLTSLTRCRSLEKLYISGNPLNGLLPVSIGNLSSSLQDFVTYSCQIKGPIPKEIGSLRNLNQLDLSDNNMTGSIPSTLKGMKSLQRLYLHGNQLEQRIPREICVLSNLGEMELQSNRLSGSIPSCIGNLSHLLILLLNSNSLSLSIPPSLSNLENLLSLNLSSNSLGGSLHGNMRVLKMLQRIDLSWNKFSGNLPTILGGFQSLSSLNLSHNSFWGPIPESFRELITLDYMDLSHNNISGPIPKSMVALSHLQYLNLSFNKLSGEIPSGGPFANFTAASFVENEALCGLPIFQVPPCGSHSNQESKAKFILKFILPAIALMSIAIAVIVIILIKYQKSNVETPNTINVLPSAEHRLISYQELRHATNDFSEDNILRVGSFGSVFKGVLFDGTTVAVKLLNLHLEGAFKSFDAECKVLARVRHRNLVRVISSCSNPELRAVVLQYMPNGSLEKWLYSHNYCLNLFQRVSIMVDVALALEYLHHGQSEPVDFGREKVENTNQDSRYSWLHRTRVWLEGRVSTRGDIYSYGIMLLEMLTRKKPTDDMFVGEFCLREWVKAKIPDKIMEVIDGNLLRIEDGRDVVAAQDHLLEIMELGLECSKEFPEERIDIKDVVVKLNKIKVQIIATHLE
ncbi:putative LRR receptor-like serine/threonine-protein kinase [Vitis vinifera]|uniref:Putative LRR receptor-like serine/threonine-protein kinase n=1 Tax=Vitis vinifera TaxID=29760 RepID=A0A438GUS0_VITVI|nr:putative LRR receptor-like serine/threonine-protein kinase [Vitis vinifera]